MLHPCNPTFNTHPQAKRQRRSKSQAANPSNANRGDSGHEPRESRSPEADDDAADEDAVMLLDDESQQAQERVRQREAHRSDILRRAAMQAAAAGGAGGDGLPEGRAVLFPGTPAAPLVSDDDGRGVGLVLVLVVTRIDALGGQKQG